MKDAKLIYLTKTLSRTKRKDYENYVINAIWNRVSCAELFPVTQQFIKTQDKQYMIDLYFPQLNIGIECDEAYHQNPEQKENDERRELTIFHVLQQINSEDYTPLHVKITTFEDVEKQINRHVELIKNKIKEKNITDGWKDKAETAEDFYKGKEYISIYDNFSFKNNKDVYNSILGKNYKGSYRQVGQKICDGTYYAWFPQLTLKRPVSSGYYNLISADGKIITEYNKDPEKNKERQEQQLHIKEKRVVFTKVQDPITREKTYRFVGVFIGKNYSENGEMIYERIEDKFKIIR